MEAFDSSEPTLDIAGEQFGIFVGELFTRAHRDRCAAAICDQSARVCFNGPANLRPSRGVDPDATTLHGKHGSRRILHELWHTRSARFPFRAACSCDKFREA